MPNWKVHLEIAKRINEKLKYTDADLEKFNLGNVLPDINNCYIVTDISKKIDHKYTHYQDTKTEPSYINYKKIFKNEIYDDPLLLGYYIHLFTDYTWNDYFYTQYGKDERIKNLTHDEKRKIKQDDFKVYNNLFMDNKPRFSHFDELIVASKKINRISIIKEDIEKVEKFLKNQEKFNCDYKILSKEILDSKMNGTIENLENELHENKFF